MEYKGISAIIALWTGSIGRVQVFSPRRREFLLIPIRFQCRTWVILDAVCVVTHITSVTGSRTGQMERKDDYFSCGLLARERKGTKIERNNLGLSKRMMYKKDLRDEQQTFDAPAVFVTKAYTVHWSIWLTNVIGVLVKYAQRSLDRWRFLEN